MNENILHNNEYGFQLTIIAIVLMTILFYLGLVREKRKLPPGPIGLPFLGYFPFLGNSPYRTLLNLSRKYGNVFSLYLGSKYVVILSDWEAVKDAFSKTATANKPESLFDIVPNGFGFSAANGVEWVEQRRFTMKAMKDIGFGRTRWEELLQEELDEVVQLIKKHRTSPIDIQKFFACTFTNNVMTLLFGERLPTGHPDTEMVSECIDAVTNSVSGLAMSVYLPTLNSVLTKLGFGSKTVSFDSILSFTDFTTKAIEKRSKTRGSEREAFVDEYICEMQRLKEKNVSNSFTERSLRGNTQGLLIGGSETSRTTLNFILIAMAEHPAVQKGVHEELDSFLGKDGRIKWADRSRIPYTFAVIMEGMRWKTLVPINGVRVAGEDIKICDYDVPRGTIIIANYWALHKDPKYWNEPEKFIPERFLLDDGKNVNLKPESYVPFSYGKRACPGELIAMMEILLYFVTLMQKFEVLPQDGTKVKYDTIFGITYQPVDAKLRFIPRE